MAAPASIWWPIRIRRAEFDWWLIYEATHVRCHEFADGRHHPEIVLTIAWADARTPTKAIAGKALNDAMRTSFPDIP